MPLDGWVASSSVVGRQGGDVERWCQNVMCVEHLHGAACASRKCLHEMREAMLPARCHGVLSKCDVLMQDGAQSIDKVIPAFVWKGAKGTGKAGRMSWHMSEFKIGM